MVDRTKLLATVPDGLRIPLFEEFDSLLQAYLEAKWSPAELGGGRYCEIVFTILDGFASGTFATSPSKPKNFVDACRRLEQNSNLPRSFQILIPRVLPALYEVRNNRGVGHVGGDVDPNFMDASFVVNSAKWVLCELVRVFHSISLKNAQSSVDGLSSLTIPMVWDSGPVSRVLDPNASMKDHVLLLISSGAGPTKYSDLLQSIEPKSEGYLKRTVRKLHSDRFLEFDVNADTIQILPPGALYVSKLVSNRI